MSPLTQSSALTYVPSVHATYSGHDDLRARATRVVTEECAVRHRRAGNVQLVVDGERLSVTFELDRTATLVHLIIRETSALTDPTAFESELGRAVRMVAKV